VLSPNGRIIGLWDDWRKQSGFDADGAYEKGPPHGTHVFVRPNKFEPGRANIVVFNWDKAETVEVDPAQAKSNDEPRELLRPGTKYRIVSATNFYGDPIVSGTYDGKPIKLPMKPTKAPPPIGLKDPTPPTEPVFGAYILLPE